MSAGVHRTAVINGRFRYELRRVRDASLPLLVVCMLNPSTADHERDDPTILTLIHFGKLWSYGGLLVVNLFGLRTSKPVELSTTDDRFGPDNWRYIQSAFQYAEANDGSVLAAWGNGGQLDGRDEWFCSRAQMVHHLELICLGTTRSLAPKHPMARGKHRVPRDLMPIVWRSAV